MRFRGSRPDRSDCAASYGKVEFVVSGVQPSRQSLQPEASQPFGKYLLLRLLARGGMAEIYLARQPGPEGFDRKVVIKRILPSLSEDPSFVEMFLDEARLAAKLAHPNIAHIYEFGEVDGAYYLSMEYIPGVTLSQLVRASKTGLPVEHAVKIAGFLCDGLQFAHSLKNDEDGRPYGIVHRDVSPQNVIVSESGGVKLLDFGIAHAVDQVHTTQQGVVKGKVSYMSPEQCRGRPLDGRSDIFSLATLLWESLTAERLFTRGTSFETMEAITRAEVPPLATYRGDIPPGLDQVLAKAFARKPDDRYANASLMQIELDRYLSRHQLLSSPPLIAAFLKDVMGDAPPAPAIGEDEPAPGDTTPAKRLPRARPGKTERSGFVVRQPEGTGAGEPTELDALETVIATPRDGTPVRTGRSAPIVMDPTASGDGPTMHSFTVPSAQPPAPPSAPAKTLDDAPPLYTFTAIPTGESPPERYAETIRRPPPKTFVQQQRREKKAASKTPWLLLVGFVFVGAAAAAGVTMWQQSTPTTTDPATPGAMDPITPPIVATPTLELRSTPPGATVRIDGIVTTQTPATIPIGVGAHRLSFEAPGRLPEEREIRVEAGQRTLEVSVELRPATVAVGPEVGPGPGPGPGPETPGPGTPPDPPATNGGGEPNGPDRPVVRERGSGLLSVDTNPWSRVYVGGRSLGETPVLTTRLPSGRHTLTFLVEGRRRVTKAVTIRDGQHTKVSFRLGGD